jgi:hypothetical protein
MPSEASREQAAYILLKGALEHLDATESGRQLHENIETFLDGDEVQIKLQALIDGEVVPYELTPHHYMALRNRLDEANELLESLVRENEPEPLPDSPMEWVVSVAKLGMLVSFPLLCALLAGLGPISATLIALAPAIIVLAFLWSFYSLWASARELLSDVSAAIAALDHKKRQTDA